MTTTAYEILAARRRSAPSSRPLYDQPLRRPDGGLPLRGEGQGAHRRAAGVFTCAFLGGPQRYTGKPLPEAHAALPLLPGHFDRRHHVLATLLEQHDVPDDVKRAWLRIDESLRTSVLAAGAEAREKTHD